MSECTLTRAVADLVERYFGPGAPTRSLAAGEVLMRAGEPNTRLYLIHSGSVSLRSERRTEIRLGPGNLIGIQSLFLRRFSSVWTDTADEPTELAWLDLSQPCPSGQPWEVELMPLVVAELNDRQRHVRVMEEQQRLTEHRLQELTYISTLGQMAAGVAHELNNALTVLDRGTDWIRSVVEQVAAGHPPLRRELLALGLARGHARRDDDLRARAAALRERGLGFGDARRLAALPLDDELLARLLDDPEQELALTVYELGATLADMATSARQASHVVGSLKQLAAKERLGTKPVDLGESIDVALSICRNALKGIELELDIAPDLRVEGNQGEFVQVWTNLVQNACDALHQAGGSGAPRIRIEAVEDGDQIAVRVIDNGPGIDPAVAEDIFKPHVTTKADGLRFGLGLGLSIVQQIVRRYGGSVAVDVAEGGGAAFTVHLPQRIGRTTRWLMRRISDRATPSIPEDLP